MFKVHLIDTSWFPNKKLDTQDLSTAYVKDKCTESGSYYNRDEGKD